MFLQGPCSFIWLICGSGGAGRSICPDDRRCWQNAGDDLDLFSYIHKVRHCNDIVGIEVLRLFTNMLICLRRRFYLSKYQICRQGCRSTWTGQWSRSTWPRTTLACHQTTSHQVPAHHGEMFHISHFDLFSYLPNRRVLQRLYTKYHHILVKNPSFPGQFFTGWCEAQSSPER